MTKRRPKRPRKPPSPLEALSRQIGAEPGVPVQLPTAERAAKGQLIVEALSTYQVQGDPPGSKPPRRVLAGYAIRDVECFAARRLKRYRMLSTEEIAAGVRLEADWLAAGLEPRMVGNLMGVGGSSARQAGVSGARANAQDAVHYALQVLRLGGPNIVHVVIGVVINGDTLAQAGASRYADEERGRAYAIGLLQTGLAMLVPHYQLASRHGSKGAAKARIAANQIRKERAKVG